MRQPKWLGALGVLTLLVAAGCEDPPAVVSTLGASPSPGPSSSSSASTSVSTASVTTSPVASALAPVTPFPSVATTPGVDATLPPFSGGTTATPVPTASPTASPSPSPTPSPTATPGQVRLTLNAPTANADFSRAVVPISVTASPAEGLTLAELDLFYDNNPILQQKGSTPSLSALTWNPSVTDNLSSPGDATPKAYGQHTLRVESLTTAGGRASVELSFFKPFLFRGWLTATTANSDTLTLPPLPQARTSVKLFAAEGYLLAFFGELAGGAKADDVQALSLKVPGQPSWVPWASNGLQWRRHVALAASGLTTYLVGGQPIATDATLAAPTDRVDLFDTFNHQATPAHVLPTVLTDTSAAVVGTYLYVVGGSTTGAASGATSSVYRLPLGSVGGRPDATVAWEPRASLPTALRGVATVVAGGHLYALGGQAADGSRRETVLSYDEVADAWVRTAYLPAAASAGSAVDIGGSVYYVGGYGADGLPNARTYRFDYGGVAATRAFADGAPNLPSGRAFEGATVYTDTEHNQRLFVAGGEATATGGNVAPLADVLVGDTL